VKGDFVFAVPGDLNIPTGGYAYDKRMVAELRELGWRPEVLNLGEGFPRPSALTRAAANAQLHDVSKGRPVVIDGLAFGVLPEVESWSNSVRGTLPSMRNRGADSPRGNAGMPSGRPPQTGQRFVPDCATNRDNQGCQSAPRSRIRSSRPRR